MNVFKDLSMRTIVPLGFVLSLGVVIIGVVEKSFWMVAMACVIAIVALQIPYWWFQLNDKTDVVN